MIPTVGVTRYVAPLREGGSLPGIVEADDLGTYVGKFHGAGQGPRVLAAEVVVSGLATLLGLGTPRLVALELDPALARYEADEEVQDLLSASPGLNLGVDFLPGAFGFDGGRDVPTETAARVLWLDAFVGNVDRTWRNPNLLWWHGDWWLIDHGASLYFHHTWQTHDPEKFAGQPWDVTDHVFEACVPCLPEVDAALTSLVTPEAIAALVAEVPDAWLPDTPDRAGPAAVRDAYVDYLVARARSRAWLPGGAR